MSSKHVIILEDEESVSAMLCLTAKRNGFKSICFSCAEDIINNINILKDYDVFIADFNVRDSTLIPVLKEMKEKKIRIPTVLNSGNVNALNDIEKAGLSEYISFACDSKMSNFGDIITQLVSQRIN